ncbi:hypothetical protein ACTFIR_001322 [Dictyostelium discoideum]
MEIIKNNNNNNNNNFLFYKLWRNIVIKNQIIEYLKLFNQNYSNRIFTIEQLKNYKDREYLRDITITIPSNSITEIHEIEPLLSYFIENVQVIETPNPTMIPYEQVFTSEDYDEPNESNESSPLPPLPFPKIIKKFTTCFSNNQRVISGLFQSTTLKTLKFGHFFSQSLLDQTTNKSIIPNGLETLYIGKSFNSYPLGPNLLPQSLTKLEIGDAYRLAIEPGWLPDDLIELDLGFKYKNRLLQGSLPNKQLKSLDLGTFKGDIEPGVLPNSITSLKSCGIPNFIGTDLCNSLPSNLKQLELHQLPSLTSLTNFLPTSLTSLEISQPFNHELLIPSLTNLIDLKITVNQNQFKTNHFINFPNSLKFLSIQKKDETNNKKKKKHNNNDNDNDNNNDNDNDNNNNDNENDNENDNKSNSNQNFKEFPNSIESLSISRELIENDQALLTLHSTMKKLNLKFPFANFKANNMDGGMENFTLPLLPNSITDLNLNLYDRDLIPSSSSSSSTEDGEAGTGADAGTGGTVCLSHLKNLKSLEISGYTRAIIQDSIPQSCKTIIFSMSQYTSQIENIRSLSNLKNLTSFSFHWLPQYYSSSDFLTDLVNLKILQIYVSNGLEEIPLLRSHLLPQSLETLILLSANISLDLSSHLPSLTSLYLLNDAIQLYDDQFYGKYKNIIKVINDDDSNEIFTNLTNKIK